jgi:hypothetical protein
MDGIWIALDTGSLSVVILILDTLALIEIACYNKRMSLPSDAYNSLEQYQLVWGCYPSFIFVAKKVNSASIIHTPHLAPFSVLLWSFQLKYIFSQSPLHVV